MDMHKISIIVPVYNRESCIQDCITSILSQTYTNIELILIDDGSTVDTSRLCDLAAANDKRVFSYHKENEGVSVARNMGIEKATGDYIQFVDSDDTVSRYMTARLVNEMLQHKTDSVLCGYKWISNKREKFIIPRLDTYNDFSSIVELMKYWLVEPIIGSPCNK